MHLDWMFFFPPLNVTGVFVNNSMLMVIILDHLSLSGYKVSLHMYIIDELVKRSTTVIDG